MTGAALPIVDSHQHVWDVSEHPQPWLDSDPALAPLRRRFSIADLAPLAAASGVSATVVVQTLTDPVETPELLALAAAEPLVQAVVGWADLTAPGVADTLASLRALPGGQFLSGIRHPLLVEPDPDWLSRAEVRRGLAAMSSAGLCFDLVPRPGQLPSLVSQVARLPGVTFVLDHLGNVEVGGQVDAGWARALAAFAALPGTACKLSGILGEAGPADGGDVSRLRPYFELALDCFGPDRLMFGSDWPVCTLSAPYGDVVAAALALTSGLSEPERAAIMAGTARAVYRISDTAVTGRGA
ncbi:MAG TPA: amidohydrolase family protein [Streptosporangiaceae bacterium]|nr:amidohydrolase family protein [Streptosporangiaceae bacterium]